MSTTAKLPVKIEHTTKEVTPIPETDNGTEAIQSFKRWNDIVGALDSNNGVCVVKMEALREIDGYGRLGVNVRQAISEKLASLGVGIIRDDLPTDASANVILLRLGTPAAEIVAILRSVASSEGREVYAANELRKLNQMPDPNAVSNGILDAIRSLGGAVADTEIDLKSVL